MLTEPQYRTFDDLIDSVKIDMYTWDLEGMINPQQLIKVAMRVNYDLGLKINQARSKAIEVHGRKAKLPADFYVLNFAAVCEERESSDIPLYNKTYSEGILEGISLTENFLEPRFVNQSTTMTSIVQGSNIINHQLHTMNVMVQAFGPDGSVLDFDVNIIDSDNINLQSLSMTTIENVKVIVMGAKISTIGNSSNGCPALLDCASSGTPHVYYVTNGRRYDSKRVIPLRIRKSQSVSASFNELKPRDDFYDHSFDSRGYYDAYIKNGFLHVNFDEGVVFINYQSLMEDDDGNLLVLDHPYCNEYYEYAIKQRIFENLLMSGETNIATHLQLMSTQLRAARNNALGFVNTPDFGEMKRTWEMNRKAQYANYYDMFKNYFY